MQARMRERAQTTAWASSRLCESRSRARASKRERERVSEKEISEQQRDGVCKSVSDRVTLAGWKMCEEKMLVHVVCVLCVLCICCLPFFRFVCIER